MKTSDFDYELPQELIAQDPLLRRDASRLMVLDKETGAIEHRHFYDITDYLVPGDCLVINNTRVIPARLIGHRDPSGGVAEILLLKRLDADRWECLAKPGKRLKTGADIVFGDGRLRATVAEVHEDGNRVVEFHYDGIFEEVLDALGEMPLPPYITHKLADKNRYQTVYAKYDGSAAAPTAGLHFTPELLDKVRDMGVEIAEVTLHVGLGTFRPVQVDDVNDHKMHSEYYEVSEEAARTINKVKRAGGRIISVGTTSTRTLEAAAGELLKDAEDIKGQENKTESEDISAAGERIITDKSGERIWIKPVSGDTEIFIYPGYKFKIVDALITNFHLPESTLLMLVSALAGKEHIMNAYEEAIRERYRFFSFGDAMFIKP